jgi:hypothetical protein
MTGRLATGVTVAWLEDAGGLDRVGVGVGLGLVDGAVTRRDEVLDAVVAVEVLVVATALEPAA